MTEQLITLDVMVRDLRESCGVKPGDIVLMHSSMDKIGPIDGGVVTAVAAIKAAVTDQGTLLLPVFSSPTADGIVKLKRVPSRVGLLTEAFRRSAGVIRSKHPTHSVACWGKRAAEFAAGHDKASALGDGSPFHLAAKAGGYVLMIGCTATTCSLIHVGEFLAPVPYLGNGIHYGGGYEKPMTVINPDGTTWTYQPKDTPGDSKSFIYVQEELERRGQIKHCHVGQAQTLRFTGMDCLSATIDLCHKDPTILLCDSPRCKPCVEGHKICQALKKA